LHRDGFDEMAQTRCLIGVTSAQSPASSKRRNPSISPDARQ